MFLTNQIAQLRVLDFTYTTSRATFPAVENLARTLYTTHRERLILLAERTSYTTWERFTVVSWKKIPFKNLDFTS